MGKKWAMFLGCLALALAVCGFLFFSSSCKKKGTEVGVAPPLSPGEIKGDLHVVSVTPQGATSTPGEAGTVVVIFDQPVVSLEKLPEGKGTSFLKFEPSFSGKFRWMGSRVLTFTPDKRFPYATEISVTVPAGVVSIGGYSLKEDYRWSFETIRPKLRQHFPYSDQQWLRLDTKVLLVFNQAVDREKARELISLEQTSPDGQQTSMGFSLSAPAAAILKEADVQAAPEEALLLEPQLSLKPDHSYSVDIREGLSGKEGPLGLAEGVSFSFSTFKVFKFENLEVGQPHDPHEALSFQFTNRVVYRDFIQKIHFEPKVEIPDYYSEWDYGNETLWLNLPFQPETEYSLRIDPELQDEFGNTLGQEVKLKFTTSAFSPMVSMTSGHGIIEAYEAPFYPVYVRNTDKAKIKAALLRKGDVISLLGKDEIFWSNEEFKSKEVPFQYEKMLSFNPPRNKSQTSPINLGEFLKNKYGLVFLQLDTLAPEEEWGRYLKAFLQVTELGISGKFSPDNNLIWVTELKTGAPVANADVEIRDDFNKVRWQGKTDKEGKVGTPGWKSLGLKSKDQWSKPQQWVFAQRGDDIAFTSSEWGTGLDPYRFGISYDWEPEPEKIRGYVFTERGIYRAGEKVSVKGIIRRAEKGQWQLPRVKKVECEIRDPFQKTVYKGGASLDDFGSFALELETAEEASLGYYQIQATVPPESPGEKETSLYESFRVEAFRPAEFEVHLRTLRESFAFGEDYAAEVRATYLFGGAMAKQKATWHLRLNPAYFSPAGHKGYVFGNELEWWDETEGREESRLLSSGEGILDAEGKLQVKLPLVPEKEKDSVMAALEATVESPSRQTISNRIQTLVHRGEYYIGLKPSRSFLETGQELKVDLITTDPAGDLAPGKKVNLKFLKREWHSVRKAGIGGRFEWLTEKKDTELATHELQSKKEPVAVAFRPEKSGFYLIYAEGTDGRGNKITTSSYFYVTGKDYVPWERQDDDLVELVADSESYQPGDAAKILVKSPYESAKALVTLERESIRESHVLDILGSSSQIEIPIKSEYIPNIFVSVLLVQGRTSAPQKDEREDIGKPSFKLGYLNLKVDPSEKRLEVDISSDKSGYKPKDTVNIKVKVKNEKKAGAKASIALAVVDVGVLNIIGYQTPNPFESFYGEKPLSVQTSETRLHVVGQRAYGEKGETVGGGGEAAPSIAGRSLAEVQLRGTFKTTAYWNPSVITDDQGQAAVSFALPDNLTTFRIMAVAQTQDSCFGRGESVFKVTKPLMLLPSLPRFSRIGDKFEGGVVVNNYTSQKGNVELSCTAEGIALVDKKDVRTFPVEPGEAKEVLFSFEVEKTGKASLEFRAKMGEETDGLQITLPLQMPRGTEAVALFASTTESAEEKVKIPEDVYLSESKLEVQAAATALTGLKGCLDYLVDYPYLCLEQRLSAVLPFLVAPKIIPDWKLSPMSQDEIQKYVQGTIKEIYNYQKDNGGFGLWPDSRHESPFLSCYATFALIKARQTGYDVDQSRLEQAARYARSLLEKKEGDESWAYYSAQVKKTIQAYALYDLALLNRPEPGYAEKLYASRDALSIFGKTLLLKALNRGQGSLSAQKTLRQELLNKIKVTPTLAHFEDDEGREGRWIYSSTTRTTAMGLQALVETGSDHPLIPSMVRWLVEQRKVGHWNSTQENFFVFYALNDFYAAFESVKPDFRVEISLAEKLLLTEMFNVQKRQIVTGSTSLAEFKAGKTLPLRIAKTGEGTLYYGARMTYAPKKKLEPRDEGLAVFKKIETLDGKPLDAVKAGSLVMVTLQVAVPQTSLYVVVDDPLPAGFEAVNPTFLTESEEQQRRLEEMEGNEGRWWWQGFNHIEMHDNRVLLFADSLDPGIHTHRYLARALTFGTFQTPGTKVEEMYTPEVFGRSSEITVKIIK